MVKIRSCSCAMCKSAARNYEGKGKARVKSLPNRKFRHETRLAIASQGELPESITGNIWV